MSAVDGHKTTTKRPHNQTKTKFLFERKGEKMRNIKKDLQAYEERFGNTQSGITTLSVDDLKEIVSKNITGPRAYVSNGFNYYDMIIDALKIGYIMGYRKAERATISNRKQQKKFINRDTGEALTEEEARIQWRDEYNGADPITNLLTFEEAMAFNLQYEEL